MTKGKTICGVLIVAISVGLSTLTGCSDKSLKVDGDKLEEKESTALKEGEVIKKADDVVESVPISNPYLNPVASEKVYDVVEQMPSFPGGQAKMMEYSMMQKKVYFCEKISFPQLLFASFNNSSYLCGVITKNLTYETEIDDDFDACIRYEYKHVCTNRTDCS